MQPLVIVPAAGYGRRVGSPEAKEMLPRHPKGIAGKKLIDGPLDLSCEMKWPVHVLTRKEKESLIQYLGWRAEEQEIHIQTVEPTRDWPETILLSRPYWREWNILFLPDIDFTPRNVLGRIQKVIDEKLDVDLIVVRHQPQSDLDKWGYILPSEDGILVGEKPLKVKPGKAWGMYAFRAENGESLLRAQLASTLDHDWKRLALRAEFLDFDSFTDLTR